MHRKRLVEGIGKKKSENHSASCGRSATLYGKKISATHYERRMERRGKRKTQHTAGGPGEEDFQIRWFCRGTLLAKTASGVAGGRGETHILKTVDWLKMAIKTRGGGFEKAGKHRRWNRRGGKSKNHEGCKGLVSVAKCNMVTLARNKLGET